MPSNFSRSYSSLSPTLPLLQPQPPSSERRGLAEPPTSPLARKNWTRAPSHPSVATVPSTRRGAHRLAAQIQLSPHCTSPLTSTPDPWVPLPPVLCSQYLSPWDSWEQEVVAVISCSLPLGPQVHLSVTSKESRGTGCCFLLPVPSPEGSMLPEPRCGSHRGGWGAVSPDSSFPPSWDWEHSHS